MKYTSRISATALLAVAAMVTSPASWALGLGDATVESYLKQPLRARIDLVTRESDDLATVSARLASAEDYELIGASLDDISVPVRFSVESEGGQAYLLATSKLPLNAPVVRLLVEVNWSAGRMLREYTLFLDPPTASDVAAPLPRVDLRENPAPSRSEPAVQEPVPEAETAAAPLPEVREESSPAADPVAPGSEYGPVVSGDTLWNIASDWAAGTGLGVNRVMIAIQRENPDAFIRGNINLLRRGVILRLPTVEAVENIPSRSAFEEVRSQEAEFRSPPSATSLSEASIPLLSEPSTQEVEETPDLESMALDPAIPLTEEETDEPVEAAVAEEDTADGSAEIAAESAPRDVLELVPPSASETYDSANGFEESQEQGDPSLDATSLREQLARTEEDLITRQQQNEYLQNRIAELEAELEAAKDSTVSDSEMAAMEARLREERLSEQSEEVEKSFFERFGVWALSLLALAAAFAAWLFSSRMREEELGEGEGDDTMQDIRDEAEDVLRTLSDDEPETVAPSEPEADDRLEDTVVVEPAEDVEASVEAEDDARGDDERGSAPADDEEAVEEDSSDPEIQLDLARAYISMGDKEAARVILEEVVENGSEEQQSEARKMLDLM